MKTTLYFYDLETSGIDARTQRIVQFAGQRVDLSLQNIGDPDDFLLQLTPDILPEPEAVLVTGITPQRTRADGITEREFLEYFHKSIATPGTIFVGFNTIRFDDEFMRALHYRNFYDPYEWQWKDGRSRWDLLDVVRMTRALRPDGIKWPFDSEGKPVNRLELLTSINGLEHEKAHNAMSDVVGSIELARLIRKNQPKLFDYLLSIRDKKSVEDLLNSDQPLVYSSGRLRSEFEKTSIVWKIKSFSSENGQSLIYDLRYDPQRWIEDEEYRLENRALKIVKHNKCPALAPLGVVDNPSWTRIGLSKKEIEKNLAALKKYENEVLKFAVEIQPKYEATTMLEVPLEKVDEMIYNGFFNDNDRKLCNRIHEMPAEELTEFSPEFDDPRLPGLYFLYRARQFPKSLLAEDRGRWEAYLERKLLDGQPNQLTKFMERLGEIAKQDYLDADKRFILEELALYAQSVAPSDGY